MSQAEASSQVFEMLREYKYVSLTTFRKSGKPVSTPVQFAMENGKLFVSTRVHSGKVKRIHNNPKVQLAPCTFRGKIVGPSVVAVASILPADKEAPAKTAIKRKYSWGVRIGNFVDKLRGTKRVYLEIVPAEGKK